MTTASDSIYEHDGLKLYYSVLGSGPPVLCVHGATGSGTYEWSKLVGFLADRYRFIVPDLRGHGRSDHWAGQISIEHVIQDLLGLIDHEGIHQPNVLAFSFGSEVALELELMNAGSSGSLVLISPGLGDRKASVPTREWLEKNWPHGLRKLHEERHGEDHWVEIIEELWGRSVNRPEVDLKALDTIGCPVLVVVGSRDDPRRVRHARQFEEAHEGCRVVEIEGGGHAVHKERPSEVAAAIGEFLDDVTSDDGVGSEAGGRENCTVGAAMTNTADAFYYDPYDFEIDADPHPVWRRMRDEAALYRNDKYDFWALSRFQDVEAGLQDWQTYSSAKGTLLELIKIDWRPPAGMFIFEDPPLHDVHRKLLSRVFTPRRMSAIEPQIRSYCARSLDPLVGSGGFDFVADLGSQMPMRVIGMLLGIPEEDQEAIRDVVDESLKLKDGEMPRAEALPKSDDDGSGGASAKDAFTEYIGWRREHPTEDLMTELLNTTFEDDEGQERRLRDDELLGYIHLLAAAGNETTTRLIGWTGYLLGEHPDQRARVAQDRSLIANTIEEVLRFEAPSPVQARSVTRDVEHYGTRVPEGSVMLLINGSANRDERRYADADRFDVGRKDTHHLSFGTGLHFCIGAGLARLEGCVALDEVLKRWPDWRIDHDHTRRAHTSTVRGWERLPVLV